MKIINKKIGFLILAIAMAFSSCQVNESLVITTPKAEFKLEQPGISSVFLNFNLPNNPAFTLVWNDKVTESASYTVEMSMDSDFTTPITLGTTDKSNFTITVADLNDKITNAGATTFKDIAIYVRIKGAEKFSNKILMLVTTFPVNPPTFNGLKTGDTFSLSLANNDAVATTIEWDDAVLQSSLGLDITYYLEASTDGTSFATPIEIANVVNKNSISLTNAQLNSAAIKSGIAPDATGKLDLRVRSVITDKNVGSKLERITNVVNVTVTTYLTVLDLSTSWGVVGDATPNSWSGPDLPFFKTDVAGVLVAYVNLKAGLIKFRENNSWNAPDKNYGDNGNGTLKEGGGNITIATAGSYKITIDLNNLTYTIENFSLGIVGEAYNNWGNPVNGVVTPDFMLEYDQYSDVFRGIVTLLDGQMKFRMNNSWDAPNKAYGDGGNGTISESGGNITVTAGIYIVTVDLNKSTYTLEPISSIWGLVGDAYNNWGNPVNGVVTPDAKFTRDWSKPFNNVWILKDVTLLDGSFKIRANNSWDAPNKAYGDGGNGTLSESGGNIVTTAGTYTISIDFSDLNNITYTKN